ncbi:amidohydrolase [Kytococcus aerolatus]|uniref:Amidohydrolase n=1 Tax=Kytococcus aerolatus TaxID=592308 RepID=A0A212U5W6_9MICO|nr:M20 family metallopeptidase [Kytococcus aerolatus]SNC73474.1 amidohydrolase [Kytococcus aerolatus]
MAPSPQTDPTALTALREAWVAALEEGLPAAQQVRERVHADPHLSGDEEPTATLLAEAMELDLERIAGTGRIGRLGPDGPAVMLRAEMDALPLTEQTGAPFAATTGAMHACGHDVHMAALVAVVRAARTLEADLPVGLVPLLQPREESYPFGAVDVTASGRLEEHRVGVAVGAHVHAGVPLGEVAIGAGVVNAAADSFVVRFRGTGGHGAYPHLGQDVMAAVATTALGLQEVVRRTVDPMRPCVLTVGHLSAGPEADNVLPETGRILGTLRTVDADDRAAVQEAIETLATRTAEAHGVVAEVEQTPAMPVLANDEALVGHMTPWLEELGVPVAAPMRSMGADDFSFYSDRLPAVMAFVGTRREGEDGVVGLHDARFLPPAELVGTVARVMVSGYLAGAQVLSDG